MLLGVFLTVYAHIAVSTQQSIPGESVFRAVSVCVLFIGNGIATRIKITKTIV